mmetsp:Transcript_14689/g.20564  ORF Transcript_14689/g.20564 Transcript_14689/m.20564 type:complete len:105 (+) Transcript_14689:313-627(+)
MILKTLNSKKTHSTSQTHGTIQLSISSIVNSVLIEEATDSKIALFGNVTVQRRSKECKLEHVRKSADDMKVNRVRFAAIAPLRETNRNKDVTWKSTPAGKKNLR